MNFTRFLDSYLNTTQQSYTFSMESGSFNTTGADLAEPPQSYSFPLDAATFNVAGVNLNPPPQGYTFNLESGAFSTDGVNSSIGSAYMFPLDSGDFVTVPVDVSTQLSLTVGLDSGSLDVFDGGLDMEVQKAPTTLTALSTSKPIERILVYPRIPNSNTSYHNIQPTDNYEVVVEIQVGDEISTSDI